MPVDLPARDLGGLPVHRFAHDGFDLAYLDAPPVMGHGEPILLIHGFASTILYNWVSSGWVKTLTDAGYRVIAFDHRGHGQSSKSYDPSDYTPRKMAGDAAALLAHLEVTRTHVMGYSMGARVAATLALAEPATVATLILGGLGIGLVEGVGDWDTIAAALVEPDAGAVTHPRGRMFRAFADQTKSDRRALAACIETSRTLFSERDVQRISQPTLIVVGSKDDIAGSPDDLAGLMPNATAFTVEGRDHMLTVGDKAFKKRALEFLAAHPL
jgi:pimeloyl-ACP methyl ester carboxylesterase